MSINITNLLDERSSNMSAFSTKVAERMATAVLHRLKSILRDSNKALPSKEKPLSCEFSFDIFKSKTTASLQEMAKDAAEFPHFNEWYERLTLPNRVIEEKDHSSFPGVRRNEKGIDQEYFLDMIAVIGQLVVSYLQKKFKEETEAEGNANLKITVTWHQKSNQSTKSSDGRDNRIEITGWLEGIQNNAVASTASKTSSVIQALEEQREGRRKKESNKNMLKIAMVFSAVILAYLLIIRPAFR